MGNNKHDWSALSLKDKADLFKIYINNGINDLNTIVKHYNAFGGPLYNEDNPIESFNGNSTIPVVRYKDGGDIRYGGIPLRNEEDYYTSEADVNMKPDDNGHLFSRNRETGRLLKTPSHETFDKMIKEELNAGYNIYKDYKGDLYSFGKEDIIPIGMTNVNKDFGKSNYVVNQFKNGTKDKQDNTTEERYNVFTDPLAEESRKKHRESLEAFVKNNPEIAGITTADFVEFLNQLSGLEGTYDKDAGKGKIYSGYYGLKGGRDLTADEQHRAAYKHLAKLFKESIVKEDVAKGKELGFTPAQVLLKYWNQGNRVTNYLYNDVDDTDGLNTKISEYGWNLTSNVNYDKYLKDGVTGDYVIVKDYKTLGRTTPLVRNSQINYSNRDSSIADINTQMLRHKKGKDDIEFEPRKLHVGDTIWLKLPDNMMSNIQPKNAVNPTDTTLIQPVEVIQPTQPVTSLVKNKTVSIPPVNTFDYGGYTGTQTVRPASENNKPYDPNFVPSFVTKSSINDGLKEQSSLRNDKEIIERLKQQAYNNLVIQEKIKNHPAFNNKTSKIRENNTKAKQYSERFFDQEIPEVFNNTANEPIKSSFFKTEFSKIENSPLFTLRPSSPLSNKAYEEMLFLDSINNTKFGNSLKSGELTNVELDYQKVKIDDEFYDLIYSKNNVDNNSEDPIVNQAYDSGEYLLAQDGFGEFYINNYKDFYKQHYGTKFNDKNNKSIIFDDALKQHIQDNIDSGNFINLVKFGRVIEGLDDYKKLVDSGEKTWDEILTEFEDKDFDILKHINNNSDKVMLEMFAEAAKPEYDYFTDSQKIAMLTNAYHESDKFRTDKQYGDGPAKGYFQFEKDHQNEYNKFLEKNNLTDSPANQFRYVAEWMLKGYNNNTLYSPDSLDINNYLDSTAGVKNMINSHKGYTTEIALGDWDSGDIELATKAFEALYEKAGKPHIDVRMKNAKKIQSLYNVFKYLYS